ncbi:MAG: hypothetical protein ACYC4S_18290, partial [Rhodoferax sp.]
MDPKMLSVELRKVGMQPKIVRLFRTCRGYFSGVARRQPQEALRADKVVSIASGYRARSDGEYTRMALTLASSRGHVS